MTCARRCRAAWTVAALTILIGLSPGASAQAPATAAPPSAGAPARAAALTDAAMEAFLLNATIGSHRSVGAGVTNTVVATLTDGTLTHDAQIQTVDISKTSFEAGKASEFNFKDSYRYNIAGYRLSRMLGMDNVPVSVQRQVDGRPAAVTWWLDDVQMTERERLKNPSLGPTPALTAQQIQVMQVFDELIQNKDRNQGNILWGRDWKLWLIDHTRAFRLGKKLIKPGELKRCDRVLLQRLRALTPAALDQEMKGMLTKGEMEALLARRDNLVKLFDERIAKIGEVNVLFDR